MIPIPSIVDEARRCVNNNEGFYLADATDLLEFFDTLNRLRGADTVKLLGHIAWLKTTIKRSSAKAAMMQQELDCACQP